jgi:hypothetical protein
MTGEISRHVFVNVLGLVLQDFGRQPVARQAGSKAALERLIASVIGPLPAGGHVVLDAPEGAVILDLRDPEAVLDLAEKMQQSRPADLDLCLGVNYGPVCVPGDRGMQGLYGDGISASLTLAHAAQPGHFLFTRSFRERLKTSGSDRASELAAMGTHTDAQVRTHEVFALDPKAAVSHRRRFMVKGAIAAAGIIAVGGAARWARLEWESRPAFVHLQIRPRGEVWVDGILKGASPPLTDFEISPGAHLIEVRGLAGQAPIKMSVNLKPTEKIILTHTFAPPRVVAPRKKEKEEGFFESLRRRFGGAK